MLSKKKVIDKIKIKKKKKKKKRKNWSMLTFWSHVTKLCKDFRKNHITEHTTFHYNTLAWKLNNREIIYTTLYKNMK